MPQSAVLTQAAFSFVGTEVVAVSISRSIFYKSALCNPPFKSRRSLLAKRRILGAAYRRRSSGSISVLFCSILGVDNLTLVCQTHSQLNVCVGTLIIGLLVPYNDPSLRLSSGDVASSPFVIAIQRTGIKGLPSVSRDLYIERIQTSTESYTTFRSSTLL